MKKFLIRLISVILLGTICGSGIAQEGANSIPRPEYPRPQFVRSSWVNLNGEWTYSFDFGKSGKQRGLAESQGFKEKIIVPFCPESPLSGVNYKDFINAMWYHREIT
ncbi:MAG: beta-glucuronidase, partial [Candidatus Aminicenantes bacterium]|nr:beta-glucuronidase [Candidatus Aminicenantes bacterium]